MQVRIVCEGRTDVLLLEQVIVSVLGPCEINPIQPSRDNLGNWGTAGWTEVKRWCRRGVEEISDEMALAGSEWIGGPPPQGLLICVPMQSTDTWLAAALDPSVSESDEPLAHLVRLGVLRPARAESKPRRSAPAYQAYASRLGAAVPKLRETLLALDRFMSKLEAVRQR